MNTKEISLKTTSKVEVIDITFLINKALQEEGIKEGLCLLYVPHTTAGLIINENSDPTVMKDFLNLLNDLVPLTNKYEHLEGNSAAHIKSILCGNSLTLMVERGKLLLGRWQGIFFVEFDGPRNRHLFMKLIPDNR